MTDITANSGQGARILVVDDDKNVTAFIADLLALESYTAIIAESGVKALEYIKQNRVDIVLLDVVMPDVDGFTVAKQMKDYFGPNNFVPIILLSAMTRLQDKVTGLSLADDFITKPFDTNELMARIRVMLRIRQLQNDLLVSKSNYQFLYENAPYMYVTLTNSMEISDCNEMFCKKTGRSREFIRGTKLLDYFSTESRGIVDSFVTTLSNENVSTVQSPLELAQEGNTEPVLVGISGSCSTNNGNASIQIAMVDVSRNIKLEKEQKIARTQLYRSARLASIGTFASGVAHELNNPLTAIMGFSSALLERVNKNEPMETEELGQYLSIINSETIRCRDIVENLSRFAREGDVQIREFLLVECVDGAFNLVKNRAAKKNITVEIYLLPSIKIKADIQKLQQAIVHVLSNAIEFSSNGANITISAASESGIAKLSIKDTGPGIAPDLLPKVFDPFFTTKDVGQGMGLGLAMCYVIMEECNGSIDVISEPNKGTTVVFEIPVA